MAASEAMAPAAQQLQQEKWKDAIPNEQKALQFLLRAEATFRQIQVAFGAARRRRRRRWRGARSGRLFDLELDTEKNQYETRQTAATSAEQKAQEIADALKKLDELAKREEDLAQQQRNGAQTAEQKWQQEMLQREAQQLQQQMEQQLAQNGQQGSKAAGQQERPGPGKRVRASGQQQRPDKRFQRSGQAATAGNRPRNRRSTACARPTTTCGAPSPRMPVRPIPAAPPTACARPPTCWAASQQQDAAGRLNSMAQTADQLAAQQKQQADHVRDLMAQQNAARTSGQQHDLPYRPGNRQDGQRSSAGGR